MWLLGENRGEKGGLFCGVDYPQKRIFQILEGCAFPPELKRLIDALTKEDLNLLAEDKEFLVKHGILEFSKANRLQEFIRRFPYFNTASFFLYVEGLMDFFQLTADYDRLLAYDEIVRRVDAVIAHFPAYMIQDKIEGFPGFRLERLFGDITSMAPWVPLVVDRDEHFIPVKSIKDEANPRTQELLKRRLPDIFLSERGASSSPAYGYPVAVDVERIPVKYLKMPSVNLVASMAKVDDRIAVKFEYPAGGERLGSSEENILSRCLTAAAESPDFEPRDINICLDYNLRQAARWSVKGLIRMNRIVLSNEEPIVVPPGFIIGLLYFHLLLTSGSEQEAITETMSFLSFKYAFGGGDYILNESIAALQDSENNLLCGPAYLRLLRALRDDLVGTNEMNRVDLSLLVNYIAGLIANEFFVTEAHVTRRIANQMKAGELIPEKVNPAKGRVLTADESKLAEQLIFYPGQGHESASLEEFGRSTLCAIASAMGGMSKRSSGLMVCNYRFDPSLPHIGGKSYMDVKLAMAAYVQERIRAARVNPGLSQPVIIMGSCITLGHIAEALGISADTLNRDIRERGYHTFRDSRRDLDIYIYSQTVVPHLSLDGNVATREDGSGILLPPGHFNFIRMLAISGVLAELQRQDIPLVFHSNMNNPAARLNDVLKGIFLNEIAEAVKADRPIPLSMWLLGENRGEKGGLFCGVDYPQKRIFQILEGCAFPPELKRLIDA
ncbi:MAG: UTP--glucose-1-phosphate uridylyltransferase, partial [Candidatus Omnitrophica bacterium]|nr:UTP--glucose-1-phosphate uridylyltransferase [Candidatus Omnitrophota bacterium]